MTVSPRFFKFFEGKRIEVLYDRKNRKLALRPGLKGYKFSTRDGIRSRRIPSDIPRERFPAKWDEKGKFLIADLKVLILG